MTLRAKELLERIASWPEEDIAMLEEAAREIEALRTGEYRATEDELRAIDEGIAQLDRGEYVSEDEMKARWTHWGVKIRS
jgi:predicted transcriptional regulator